MENNKNLIATEISYLQSLRDEGQKAFVMPTKKDEYWQYTNLAEISSTTYQYSNQITTDFDIDFNAYKIFFENGFFCPQKSDLPEGFEVVPLIEAIITNQAKDYLAKIANNKNPFVLQNNANIQEGVFIRVAKNINIKKPIAIISYCNQSNTWNTIRNIISIEENSSAEVLEYFAGNNDNFSNIVNEVYLDSNAKLHHYKINISKAKSISNTFIDIKKDAVYNNFSALLNGSLSRNQLSINLLESGANAECNVVYKSSESVVLDNTIQVFHKAKNTTSNQLIKGVVGGFAKGVYQGKISIDKGCDNVIGNQQHRAILLSDSASVKVKPELEIFNDDVKCSHGSAIGKLDEKALFYLQSRGIAADAAKSLLINAFLQESVDRVQNLDIKNTFLLAI